MSEDIIEINPNNIANIVNSLYDRAETAVRLACYEDADRLADRADNVFNAFMQMMHRKYGIIRANKPAKEAKQMPPPEYAWPANCANILNIVKYISVFNGR